MIIEDILFLIIAFGVLIIIVAINNIYFKNILFVFLLFAILSGCATTQIKEPLFIKCQVPDVPKAELYPLDESKTYPEKLQSILNNYFLLQKEVEMLRKAQEVCK